jgi:hypothetical protein
MWTARSGKAKAMVRIVAIRQGLRQWIAAVVLLPLFFCSPIPLVYTADSFGSTQVRGAPALYVPLEMVAVEYHDNTRARPEKQFDDTFFIDAANGLALYELSRIFQVLEGPDSLRDSLRSLCRFRYSRIDSSRDSLPRVAALVRAAAKLSGADFVVLPYACSIRHSVIRQPGWRNDKYESGHYERPTEHAARARFHIQVWTNDGEILYERAVSAVTREPFLYSMFKQAQKGRDIAVYARKYFAPPMVKALSKAIRESLRLGG